MNDDPLAGWSEGPTATGYVPTAGQHVFCYRPHDGKTCCGFVEDSRLGLYLATCRGGRAVLTSAHWNVLPMNPGESCRYRMT